jgi:energy-coupling factor transport system substrate-specific component
VVAAYLYGLLLNLSSWPFVLGIAVPGHEGLAFVPGDPLSENLHRFFAYTLITSTGSFDTGRAVTNAVAIVVLGPAVLTTLRRAARRAVVTGTVEKLLPGAPGGPSVGSPDEHREEATMSTPSPGLRREAGSQI